MPTDDPASSGSHQSDTITEHDVRILSPDMVNGRLISAARNLLGWEQRECAERASIRRQTLAELESGFRKPQARIRKALLDVLAEAGIRFIEIDGMPGLYRLPDGHDPSQGT